MSHPIDDAARLEDLAWMAASGETPAGAAARLGITLEALDKWTDRRGLRDLWVQLRRNDLERQGYARRDIDVMLGNNTARAAHARGAA